jgi:transposase-like protein
MTEIYCPNCGSETLTLSGDGKIKSMHLVCTDCKRYWVLLPNSPRGQKQ